MIIVKLTGGLGNQMFQYAAGKSLAEKYKSPLMLDVSFFGRTLHGITKRSFELSKFNITDKIVSANYIKIINWVHRNRMIQKINTFLPISLGYYWGEEKRFEYNNDFDQFPSKTYLDGYWQSEKYFLEVSEAIRDCYKFSIPSNLENKTLMDKIVETNAVSVHIRRGDYLHNNSKHRICTQEYYINAIEFFQKKMKNPVFYFFSDDIDWVKKNMVISGASVFVQNNEENGSFEDMGLMSLCKHNIIANSSFSWWAAWLNKNADKVVVAPQNWFVDNSIIIDDLIPKDWLKMKN